MSSEIGGEGIILAAVALPVGAAFGAGWLAWQSGKLLVNAGIDIIREIEATQERVEQEKRRRYLDAVAENERMTAMCRRVLSELEISDVSDLGALEEMKAQLRSLCEPLFTEDSARIESMNILGVQQLERIIARHNHLQELHVEIPGRYEGFSVADLMDDLRLVASAAMVRQTLGENVWAVDADSWEREELNKRLVQLRERIRGALNFVTDYSKNCGVSKANHAWFSSCFNGIHERLEVFENPDLSIDSLKRGLQSLEETMDRFDMLRPSFEQEKRRMYTLYEVYRSAAAALGRKIHQMRYFKCSAALEEELDLLRQRSERAKYCAQIYQKLGPAAYMCYAWDEELKAMGYAVYTRKAITQMAQHKPERAKLGESKMPFYQWDANSLTQLYQMAPHCSLQLVVNPDGSITMQTIAEGTDDAQIRQLQNQHCRDMELLYQRLLDNWFIRYDYQEKVSSEHVCTVDAWRLSRENEWTRMEDEQVRVERDDYRRTESKSEQRRMK